MQYESCNYFTHAHTQTGRADGLREARDAKRDADRARKLHGDDDVVVSHLLTLTRSIDGWMIAGSCDGRRHGARENVEELRRRRRALNIGGDSLA